MATVDITGISHAELLQGLYLAASPKGLGFLHYTNDSFPIEEAEKILNEQTYVDYLNGRVIKTRFKGSEIRSDLYDRDNGQGMFQVVVDIIKKIKHDQITSK